MKRLDATSRLKKRRTRLRVACRPLLLLEAGPAAASLRLGELVARSSLAALEGRKPFSRARFARMARLAT